MIRVKPFAQRTQLLPLIPPGGVRPVGQQRIVCMHAGERGRYRMASVVLREEGVQRGCQDVGPG